MPLLSRKLPRVPKFDSGRTPESRPDLSAPFDARAGTSNDLNGPGQYAGIEDFEE